jgi:tetratricopeptide (TPR) repeat protein
MLRVHTKVRRRMMPYLACMAGIMLVGAGCATAASHTRSGGSAAGYEHGAPPEPDKAVVYRAIRAMDSGDTAGAIRMLEDVRQRRPRNTLVLHELALAYRLADQPARAIAVLEPHRAALPASTLALLGSAHDEAGDVAAAERVFRESLQTFPNSGLLHAELATSLRSRGELEEALALYQKGISVEPTVAVNYLHAATMLASTESRGQALVYGETYRLMTQGEQRSQLLAQAMVDLCRSAVVRELQPDGTYAVNVSLSPGSPDDSAGPTGLMMFELSFGTALAALAGSELTLSTLHAARAALVSVMDETAALVPWDDTPLFRWLRGINAAGHLQAYDVWMFSPAFHDEAQAWIAAHDAEVNAMADYVETHPLFAPAQAAGD